MEQLLTNPVFWALLVFSASTILAIYGYFAGKKLDRDGIRVKAVVLDRWVKSRPSSDDHPSEDHTYYVKAYFDNEEGFQQTVSPSVTYSTWKASADEIDLIYPPGQPKRAQAADRGSIYLQFGIGVFFMVLSGAFLVCVLFRDEWFS